MRKSNRILLLLLLSAFSSFAQETDGTWQGLKNEYFSLGRARDYEGRIEIAKELLEFSEKNFGTEHTNTGISAGMLAGAHSTIGQYEQAEALYIRALEISEKNARKHPVQVAGDLNRLAAMYSNLGRYAEAEPLFHRELKIRQQELHLSSHSVLSVMKSLAHVYYAQGKTEQGDDLYKQALKITEDAYGENSPKTESLIRAWNSMIDATLQ